MPPRATLLALLLLSLGTLLLMPKVKHRLRRVIRSTLHGFMTLRSRPLQLDAGSVLVIAPHQDDGSLGCGGLVFQQRLAGASVHVLYLTDGSASHQGHPTLSPAALSALRYDEARLAKSRLYLDSACLHFLDLPDGRLLHLDPDERKTALDRLAERLAIIQPQTILLPWRHDGSTEHEAGFKLVSDALARQGLQPRLLEYPVWANYRPLLLVRPSLSANRIHRFRFSGYGPVKRHALAAYATQFEATPPWTEPILSEEFLASFASEHEFFFELKS